MQHARLTETETRRFVRIEHQALRTNSGSFGDIAGDPPRLIFGEQLGRRTPAGFVLQIDVGQFLPGVVLHDTAGVQFFDGAGRQEAAGRRGVSATYLFAF